MPDDACHQQCHVNYRKIRRTTVWSYEFHRRIDGRVPHAEGTRPREKLTIPTDLAIVHITLLVVGRSVDIRVSPGNLYQVMRLEGGEGLG